MKNEVVRGDDKGTGSGQRTGKVGRTLWDTIVRLASKQKGVEKTHGMQQIQLHRSLNQCLT
eukprot:scaffold19803_cov108-Skeletonema_dohrnii-CCMP3373.AAC.1